MDVEGDVDADMGGEAAHERSGAQALGWCGMEAHLGGGMGARWRWRLTRSGGGGALGSGGMGGLLGGGGMA